jgi:hypothetical protein
MEIIQERAVTVEGYYQVEFDSIENLGRGFSFDCDKDGMVNDLDCEHRIVELLRDPTYLYRGVVLHHRRYTQPRIGRCACGEEVALEAFTNTCSQCGRDYNMSGQELAPRSQWGEETGEHWSECY